MIGLGLIFLLVGLGMFGGSIAFGLWRRSFLKTALAATGVVLASGERQHRRHHHGGGIQIGGRYERWYYPIVRFQTADGQIIDYTSSVGTKTPYVQGQNIPINYDPKNPHSVTFGARGSFLTWLPFIFVGCIGGVFGFAGLIICVVAVLS